MGHRGHMTSRLGSIIVAGFLSLIVIVAVAVILVLTGNQKDDATSAILVPNLQDGDVVLLDAPIEIRIVVRANEVVSGVSLIEDGQTVVRDALPVPDINQNSFSSSLTWIPKNLGFVDLIIRALTESGMETDRRIRIEVTDDPSRIKQKLQVTIITPTSGEEIRLHEPFDISSRIQSTDVVTLLRLKVNDVEVSDLVPTVGKAPNEFLGTFRWKFDDLESTILTILARTVNGEEESASVTIRIVDGDELENDSINGPGTSNWLGNLVIQSPLNGAEYKFSDDLNINLGIVATGTENLETVELYVNTVLYANMIPKPLADGSYRLTIPFEPTQPGIYRLEVVAISTNNHRFDHVIDIAVIGEEIKPDSEDQPAADLRLPDLSIATISVGENNAVVVRIENNSNVPIVAAPVLFSVIRASDNILLDEAIVVLTISANGDRTISLPVFLTDPIDVTVVVDAGASIDEIDETNNQLTSAFSPSPRPDLVIQDVELSIDRIAIIRVTNIGTTSFTGTININVLFKGEILEKLAFTGSLVPQGSLTLSGGTQIQGGGQLSIIADPDNLIAETDEGNNTLVVSLKS